jgi:hypothetical protein
MNFFLLSGSQRILAWRQFRSALQGLSELQQLDEVAKFWGDAPLQTYVVDWDKAHEWPCAWQLIHDGDFDSNIIALLMEQTLILVGWNPERLKLMYVKDSAIEEQMMILVIDERWVLNYSYYEVFELSKIQNHFTIYIKYQSQDEKHVVV